MMAAVAAFLLMPAQAFNTGDLALIGYFYQGVCPPDPVPSPDVASGCFHDGTPSVDCRQENLLCPSTQIQAVTLQSETQPGPCTAFTWRWYCTEEALVHCANHLWCDPLALCNASVPSCTCQGNLVSLDHNRCGCDPDFYRAPIAEPYANSAGQWTNYSCEPVTECNATLPIEVAAPTPTSDRVCAATTTTTPPPSTDRDDWYSVSVVLLVAIGIALVVLVTMGARNYKSHGSVCPA